MNICSNSRTYGPIEKDAGGFRDDRARANCAEDILFEASARFGRGVDSLKRSMDMWFGNELRSSIVETASGRADLEIGQMEMNIQVASLAKMQAFFENVVSDLRQNAATFVSRVDGAYSGQEYELMEKKAREDVIRKEQEILKLIKFAEEELNEMRRMVDDYAEEASTTDPMCAILDRNQVKTISAIYVEGYGEMMLQPCGQDVSGAELAFVCFQY